MKFGVREICNVVLKAKATMTVGSKTFFKNEPVLYFDTLKTSSMEGASTTVYAQGGRGNSRLVAWDGEKTVTFTMEDALISPEGLMILAGANLISAADTTQKKYGKVVGEVIYQHMTETIDASSKDVILSEGSLVIKPTQTPAKSQNPKDDDYAYVMLVKDGEIFDEPYIAQVDDTDGSLKVAEFNRSVGTYDPTDLPDEKKFDSVIIDYYTARESGAKQIEITPESFGGNFYLEAQTLFRNQNGMDMPAEFIIPNCKIQSNFTFTMASSGDPSTFTFTLDAFPDYTRWDHSKKVLAVIQIIEDNGDTDGLRNLTNMPIDESNDKKEDEKTETTFKVTFIKDGEVLEVKTVESGKTVTAPAGVDTWYIDEAFAQEFDFDTEITADKTLYAKAG